jgi:hypothetical protein
MDCQMEKQDWPSLLSRMQSWQKKKRLHYPHCTLCFIIYIYSTDTMTRSNLNTLDTLCFSTLL